MPPPFSRRFDLLVVLLVSFFCLMETEANLASIPSRNSFTAKTDNLRKWNSRTSASTTTTDNSRDTTKEVLDAFLTRDSRNSFISRVYAILAGQLAITATSILLFATIPSLRSVQNRLWLPIISLCMSTFAWFFMFVNEDARRKSPLKWQMLSLFTAGEAVSVGFLSSFYKFRSVISALLATAVATGTVSIYTLCNKNPKYDLTQWGSSISTAGLIFLVYGIVQIFQYTGVLPPGFLPYSETLYCLIGSTIFSFYLAYHTRLIIAGKHAKYQMNEKDYVFGAMVRSCKVVLIVVL